MSTTQNILSVGAIASSSGFPVSRILKAATALNLRPEITIDRVPHFSDRAAAKIETYLFEQLRKTM
jgi:hypothetical protein